RKISGAARGQLIRQFLSESILINLLSVVIAVILVQLLHPVFNQITGSTLDLGIISNPGFWGIIILVFIIGAILSGTYPAFFLSSFRPVTIIKGKFSKQSKELVLRKSLVIFQFITSFILISGTLVVYKQIIFMEDYDLGVDINDVIVLPGPDILDSTYTETFNAFKEELLRNPNIIKVSTSTAVPGRKAAWNAGGIRLLSQTVDEGNQYRVIGTDFDFVKLYGLSVVEGRNFSPEYGMNDQTVLFNETGVKLLGFIDYKEALDKQIFFWGDTFRIVGVLKNYHQQGLNEVQDPLIFRFYESLSAYYSIKHLHTADIQTTLTYIQEEWNLFFSKNPFEYFFLDDYYKEQYKDEFQFGIVFGTFSFLAIFIACLGLFGLSSYTTVQRTKEIGIRKVLGASVLKSILLLVRYFVYQILIAAPFGLVTSYLIMSSWIENFPFRISIGWWFFLIPVLIILIIAVFTVIIQVFKTANVNPAESLRYE
ncbi:MAG: FtsX-like permease family protein, partial [Bacteroidales bacterium]